ncbi:uncharacterized protein MYCFIDRAFT_210580 [Pseudocercospora fijiensis CIRAD86]|uniref:AA1-like domain-containing protein n=1 Tax=Pseudocercospora fijiensis (strain CIRAD86) TaxID=383855 RepID=M3BBL4_PSEFD|nr:uncharacterized protein MYCFIDRAFT_210580 [Pseudocercospora fijiensis CIRAD86]EME86682.1 hypothetical protein MYCFIDRAFT_210580 [Pseudocercospora fijiensis CIRAD86]
MRSAVVLLTSLLCSSVSATLYFNATLSGTSLTVNSWDDTNNDGKQQPQDIICSGKDLQPVSSYQWMVKCTGGPDKRKSDTVFDVFLEPNTKRFLDVIYRYSNPDASALNVGDNADQFLFNFRVGSVDGKFFKSREFAAQQDILHLVKPEALKNPCDSLDSC